MRDGKSLAAEIEAASKRMSLLSGDELRAATHDLGKLVYVQSGRIVEGLRAAANQSRAFEDGARWKTTGRATVAFGGGGTREWFRQSDGCLKDYPTGFDPNTGAYSSMVAQWIDRPLQPEGERSDA